MLNVFLHQSAWFEKRVELDLYAILNAFPVKVFHSPRLSFLCIMVKRKDKKDKAKKNSLSLLFAKIAESKREVRTTYLVCFKKKREVQAIYFLPFVKSELHIESQKGSQNYIFVKSKLHICLWKTCISWSRNYIFLGVGKSELHISWSQNYIFEKNVKSGLRISWSQRYIFRGVKTTYYVNWFMWYLKLNNI
jgi:hypothetical protein